MNQQARLKFLSRQGRKIRLRDVRSMQSGPVAGSGIGIVCGIIYCEPGIIGRIQKCLIRKSHLL